MNMLWAILVSLLSIFLFILHSYYKRGFRLTFNFFFFAFLVAVIKEGPMRINGILMKNPTMPYEFLEGQGSVIIKTMLAITGWVFTFYLGWYIAERVAQRLGKWGNRIFVVTFLSGLVTASIGYSVEATAIGIGWWHWTIESHELASVIVGVPFIVFETWMHFPTQYLLLPFFLIEYSRFKTAAWKEIFFLIPFLHSITTHCRPELFRVSVEYTALFVLIVLAFISPLQFDCSGIKVPILPKRFLKPGLLDSLPAIVSLILLTILAFLDVAKIHNQRLLISLLPTTIFVMLSFKKISLSYIFFFIVACLIFIHKEAIPAMVPIIIVLIFQKLARVSPNPR